MEVALLEQKPIGALVIPLAQLVRGGQAFEPVVDARRPFGQPARPEPVHQHARTVGARRLVIGSFDLNWHDQGEIQSTKFPAQDIIVICSEERPYRLWFLLWR